MKMAKFYKITLLFTALIMSIIVAFSMMTFGEVSAAKASEPSKYFSGVTADKLEFKDDALVATVEDGAAITLINQLVVDDFSASIVLPDFDKIETVNVKFVSHSYFVNGIIEDGKLVTDIENVLTIKSDGTAYLNGDTAKIVTMEKDAVITVKAQHGYLTFNNELTATEEYRVDAVGAPIARLSFEFDLKDGVESTTFGIKSINQKVSDADAKYEQLFTVDDDGVLNDTAYPRVTLNDDLYTRSVDGDNRLVFTMNVQVKLDFNVYSVLGNKASDFYLEKSDAYVYDGSTEKPKWLKFETVGEDQVFNVTYGSVEEGEYVEQFKVDVVKYGVDKVAPVYVDNDDALESFKSALEKAYTDDGNSVYLGKEVEIPSLADLVFDNETPYSKLNATVYYRTPSDTGRSSDMTIKVKEAGDYLFYVSFSDGENSMDEKDFFETNEDESFELNKKYSKYIFRFHIADDAPISIETGSATGVGFKGITYTASPFKIDADGCTTSYKLYYNANKDAKADDDGWKFIPEASVAKNNTYSDEFGNTYSYVKAVNYDGKLTFNPTKTGVYKILCEASSEYTTRSDSSYKMIIVENEPVYVEVPSTWLRDNVWSVVFLSVGTLCLFGIIVLLCIKPKDETESN